MVLTIDAVFDGQTFRPIQPIELPPNTSVQIAVTSDELPVQSLLDVAETLALEEPPDWSRHIEINPTISGGKPRIAGHRITVQNVVIWHEHMGKSADEIAAEYNLSLAEVYAALAYYFDHRPEIEQKMRDDQAFVASLQQQSSSVLQEKLKAQQRGKNSVLHR